MTILVLFAATGAGCALVNKVRAKNELNETARAYREGHFEEAEQHAKRALQLDPDNKTAPIFIARVVHQEYERTRDAAKGREAIDAYQKVLAKDPNHEEAYKAVSVLYAEMNEEQKLRDWIGARATNTNLKPEERAEAYAVLAGKDWDCSFKITELVKVISPEKAMVTYNKPKDPKDFDTANKCVIRGLEEANKAISLDANNVTAWRYEASLFREQAKLAEMDGKADLKAAATKKAEEAFKRTEELEKLKAPPPTSPNP